MRYLEECFAFDKSFTQINGVYLQFKANTAQFDGVFKSFVDSFTATANKLKEENPQLASFQVRR